MKMTRGDFLKSVAAGAGAALSGLPVFGAHGETAPLTLADLNRLSPAERNRRLAEILSKDAFTRQLSSTFRLSDPASTASAELRLSEVTEGRANTQYEQFALLFVGPAEPVLEQKTYRLEHAEMGAFDIFLVPIRADETAATYEAVFNRRRD